MPCSCMQSSVGAQTRTAAFGLAQSVRVQHQLHLANPRLSRSSQKPQSVTPFRSTQTRGLRQSQHTCRAQKQEEQEREKDIVGGFDVNAPDGFLESEAVGIAVRVAFFLIITGGIAALFFLAKPVVDNTINSFPYRSSGGATGSSEQSLIPGLDSKAPEGASIFD